MRLILDERLGELAAIAADVLAGRAPPGELAAQLRADEVLAMVAEIMARRPPNAPGTPADAPRRWRLTYRDAAGHEHELPR
jgi:hypothetical protein